MRTMLRSFRIKERRAFPPCHERRRGREAASHHPLLGRRSRPVPRPARTCPARRLSTSSRETARACGSTPNASSSWRTATSSLPPYLRFLRGVVDSEDLSLNVSREMLQENRRSPRSSNRLSKQVLKALKDLGESDEEKYLASFVSSAAS